MEFNCAVSVTAPFSFATVVMADSYLDTFPYPQNLELYLQNLFLKLEVETVSSQRPVTIRGSWKTLVMIDAFLKTLISTLSSAITKGAVPNEEDFSAAFKLFKESGYSVESKPATSQSNCTNIFNSSGKSNNSFAEHQIAINNGENEETYTTSYTEPTEKFVLDKSQKDKWYFNANPRGKTSKFSNTEKVLPEPFIVVEAEKPNKSNQPSITEIEKALCQVYKKETIEKYRKKSSKVNSHLNSDNTEIQEVKEELDDMENLHLEFGSDNLETSKSEGIYASTELQDESCKIVSKNKLKKHIVSKRKKKKTLKTRTDNCNVGEIKYSCKKSLPVNKKLDMPSERRQSARQKLRLEKNKVLKASELLSSQNNNDFDNVTINNHTTTNQLHSKTELSDDESKMLRDVEINMTDQLGKEKNHSKNNILKSSQNTKDTENMLLKNSDQETGNKGHRKRKTVNKLKVKQTTLECDMCSYETTKPLQLEEHKRRVHLTKKFTCEICSKEFGYQKDLRRHMKCHSKAENCCDVCGKMYKDVRKLVEHKKVHSEDYVKPKFPCNFCSKSFSTKYVLAYHIKSNHLGMKRSFICPTCGKGFSQKNSYMQHANVHLGIRPFACEVCGKKFSYEKSLKEHAFMHRSEKAFSCKICNKTFRQASGLTIHMKVHKETKDYVCSMCGKGFSQRQAMVRHERIHVGEKPFECGLCKRSFADSSVLRRHMILIHKKDPKLWREDTVCHTQKRTDFFISVLGTESDVVCIGPSNFTQFQGQTEDLQQNIPQPNPSDESDPLMTSYNKTKTQCLNADEQFNAELDSSKLQGSIIKEEPSVTLLKDTNTTYSNSAINVIASNVIMSDSGETQVVQVTDNYSTMNSQNQNIVTSSYSSSQYVVPTNTSSLQSIISVSPHAIEIPEHLTSASGHLTLATSQSSQSTAFIPINYAERQFEYEAGDLSNNEIQHYATMMSQPYSQSIVVIQDNLGTFTYHQQNVNVGLPEDTTSGIHLQNINQNP
ncbi:zinc finger and BTB domain-containing protein 24-like [Physella acuta]|uniref:zinc finger and BTB domain-containing protein 24-like n=1 Tax=Physella acuta TaxID=109671 RepID=UPI0027DAB6BF|nr:zinc finger and BTB domain-containing protein 24-like [Physella acuta]